MYETAGGALGVGRYLGIVGARGRFEAGRLNGFGLTAATFTATGAELQAARAVVRGLAMIGQ